MSIFYQNRDLNTFKSISKQLTEKVIDIEVLYFKLNTQQISTNIYDEAKKSHGGRKYNQGVKLHALVQHEAQMVQYQQSMKYNRLLRFKFLITTLQDHNVYPEVGDVICWSRQYFQISKVTQQQLIASRPDTQWSKVCESTIISNSKILKLLEHKSYESERL